MNQTIMTENSLFSEKATWGWKNESGKEAKIWKRICVCPMSNAVHHVGLSDASDTGFLDVITLSAIEVIFS